MADPNAQPVPVAPAPAPAQGQKIQNDPRFRQLPRHIQKQVESGQTTLDVLEHGGSLDRFGGPDPPGGGGLPKPPGTQTGGGEDLTSLKGPSEVGILGQIEQGGQDEGQDVEGLIKEGFQDILSGKKGSFSDETFANLKQALFESTRGQAKASQNEALRTAALTGTFRSPATQRVMRDIDTSARSQFTQGVRELMIEKAKAEWSDRMQGLQMAQQWLQQRQSYVLGKAQIAATLESARIQASATVRAASISAGATRDAARAGAGAARAGIAENARQFDAEMAFRKEQANLDRQFQTMNFLGGSLGLFG